MKLTDLSIDNFGALSRFTLGNIGPGLNVIQGPNGSGKTTLLQFVRGVFAGFNEARRLHLIPPVGSGASGGSVGVEWGSRKLAVIRHSRPDEYETLAINVRQGATDEGQSLRRHIESFDDERLSSLFTAGSFDANSVEALIGLARHDGIDLSSMAGNESLLFSRLVQLREQRESLVSEAGRVAALRDQCEAIAALGLETHRQAAAKREQLARSRAGLQQRIADTIAEADRLHLDWQAVHCDLTECESRLLSGSVRRVEDVVYVQECVATGPNPRLPEVEELDLRIEHLRVVLKDLAATRLHVSATGADSLGADVPARDVFVARQRESLRVMQLQLQALAGTVQWIGQAGACVCTSAAERLGSIADELRRQVELSCQELSRQQAAWRLDEIRGDRAAIDHCEAGLVRQMNWLRQRREELLDASIHPTLSRLAHTVSAERRYCGCPEHTATSRVTTPRSVTRRTVVERFEADSLARPDDSVRRAALQVQSSKLWRDWQSTIAASIDLETALRRTIAAEQAVDVEPTLDECERKLKAAQADLKRAEEAQGAIAALDLEIERLSGQMIRDRSSRVIVEASEHLDLLTLGRYRALRISDDGLKLQIIAENGSPYVASALSRGTLFQVALALRVALVDEYARRGLEFPLVLDDVLVDSDEERLEAAAHLLSTAAERGRQVIFLTCQDHLVTLLERRGAVIQSLPGASRIRREPIAFIPAEPPAPRVVEPVALPPAAVVEPAPMIAAEASTDIDSTAEPQIIDFSVDLPASAIPSMSMEHAELLAGEGVRTVGQVIEIDPDAEVALLSRVGASRLNITTWQSEAHLLCCIPELAADDVQLLVAVGVHAPHELANLSPDTLYQRILRFRGASPHAWHRWMCDRSIWPREEQVSNWIRWAQSPRPLRPERGSIPLSPHFLPAAIAAQDDDDPQDDPTSPAGSSETFRSRRRRSRGGRSPRSGAQHARGSIRAQSDESPRYYLTLDGPIVDAPSIGPKTARMLNRAGVQTVSHLLTRSPSELAETIGDRSITAQTIQAWQQQSQLMCDIPELRGHDAQLLVACGFPTVQHLSAASAAHVMAKLSPFARSRAGQRLLRSAEPPTLEEVETWIRGAAEDKRSAA